MTGSITILASRNPISGRTTLVPHSEAQSRFLTCIKGRRGHSSSFLTKDCDWLRRKRPRSISYLISVYEVMLANAPELTLQLPLRSNQP